MFKRLFSSLIDLVIYFGTKINPNSLPRTARDALYWMNSILWWKFQLLG